MSCEEIKKLLDEYITGELDKATEEIVKEHLAVCADCKREYEDLKRCKSELVNLAEDTPKGFNDRLKTKIKSTKRFAFFGRHYGAGIAAAVVLVCLIGLGYGYGYVGSFEDKINAVKSGGATDVPSVVEDVEEKTTLYIEENNEEKEEMLPQMAEATTEAVNAVESTEDNATEITTELFSKSKSEKNVVKLESEEKGEAEIKNNAKAETLKVEETKDMTNIAPNVSENVNVIAESDNEPEMQAAEAFNEDTAIENNDMGEEPMFKSAATAAGGLAQDETDGDSLDSTMAKSAAPMSDDFDYDGNYATLNIKKDYADSVKTALEESEQISLLQSTDEEITVQVCNLSYKEFKEQLSEWTPEEEGAVPEDNCSNFSLVIKWT